ncbi:MAG TPA: GNAT family N-acetyltransferase [Burkholderiales bacterium]|nr:GNAT family N-acetyltransferase [Burkholderiales bacterium]
MGNDVEVRRATRADAQRIAQIYNGYVRDTVITFETEPVPVEEMAQRIERTIARYDWLVAESNREIVGYAYYGQFRTRAAYDHTVESTVYVAAGNMRRGVGRTLYAALMRSARERGFREVIGVIALPNPESTALHATMGFAEAGVLKRVGYKFGAYIDVAIWQLSLA